MGLCTSDLIRIIKLINMNHTTSICMLGRQNINTTWSIFLPIVDRFKWSMNEQIYNEIKNCKTIDAYKFFKMFGVKEVHAIDYNEIDGADIIFNLNDDLPEKLVGKFDMVINGGTSEHVFDIAKAMVNMSKLVKKEGIIVHILPLAGYIEHGFYSFSPTFFSDFYEKNDWEIIDLNIEFRKSKNIPQSEWTLYYSEDLRMFQTYKDGIEWMKAQDKLNDYIQDMFHLKNMGNAMIWCIAKRRENMDFLYPTQKIYTEISKKNCKKIMYSTLDLVKLEKILVENKGKELALYGGGYIADKVIDFLYQNDYEQWIKCIFDINIKKAGTSIRGYKIYYPTRKKLLEFDQFIICSNRYEKDMYDFLVNQGINKKNIRLITE